VDNRVGCAQNSFGLKGKSIGLAQTLIAKTPIRLFLARLDTRDFKPQSNHRGKASTQSLNSAELTEKHKKAVTTLGRYGFFIANPA
jgi:hypothetical protein